MRRVPRTTQVAVAMSLLASGCYGPFNLTRQLHHWNGQVGDKYANELVFVAFTILPAYGVAVVGDAVLFNSLEFWTGHNPVFMSRRVPGAPSTRRSHASPVETPHAEEQTRSVPAG